MADQPVPGFPGLLRQLRAEAGLTQEELARAAGLGLRTVSDLERGAHRTAHQDTARLLADALGLPGPVHGLFVAAARGRAGAEQVLAARSDAAAALAAAVVSGREPRAAPVPRELPADVSAFTGRAVELAELDLLMPGAADGEAGRVAGPVVISALSGTAGVGKTALAVRWAHRVAEAFPDGQLYVNLRGYDSDQPVPPEEALARFLRALGVADQDIPPGAEERAARYRSLVAGKRLLVILDNAATEEQVRPLLPGSGSMMVVVTSRDSLTGLVARDGARRLDLDLLRQGDAVALLTTLIGRRAEADPEATEILAGQCARLPLALRVAAELAASRADAPLAELVAELADQQERLQLLDAGGDPRGAVAGVFSWSYQHLPEDAARMFRLLGLHPSQDWDQYAAAALIGTISVTHARRLLAVLARAHLIQPTGAGRYQMHDLLRAYAAGLAASHDSGQGSRAALAGLFDYYLAASAVAMDCLAPAERKNRPDPPSTDIPVPDVSARATAVAWLDTELATLVSICAHTAKHGWPGHATRLASMITRYLQQGHFTEGIIISTHVLNAARGSGDRVSEARALAGLGLFHMCQSRYTHAIDCHQRALVIARDIGDRFTQFRALANLAYATSRQGRYQQAIDYCKQALALDREVGYQVGKARVLGDLGRNYLRQGQYGQAADQLQQALTLSREIGDPYGEAETLACLGEVRYRQGQYGQAADQLQQACTLSREIGDRQDEAEALTRLGEVRLRQGSHGQAAECYEEALALFRELGEPGGEADALNGSGETLLATGHPNEARTCHTTALTLARQGGDRYLQARALTGLGEVGHRQGDPAQAAVHHRDALAIYQQIGARGGQTEALNGSGEALLATGQPAQAHTCHTTALTLARQTGDRYQQARAHNGLAKACHAAGQLEQASRHRQHALDIYTDLGVTEAAEMHAVDASAAGTPLAGEAEPTTAAQ